ncbi:MAG: permease [Clostridiales bacterium]|nr:permease [Clostridiales bacterium]
MENQKKKSLKWLWIAIAVVVVIGIAVWCGIAASWGKTVKVDNQETTVFGISNVIGISTLLAGIFIVSAVGYMLGRITIKGVSLGTAGVFLVAILFGFLCTLIPENVPVLNSFFLSEKSTNTTYYKSVVQNVGLVLFVGSVGFIAGPKFFRDLKKNFKTYILMGIVIILAGTAVAVAFALIPGIGADFSSGVLSGALTSTPGYSAAKEVAGNVNLVTLGHAIAYPFGVVGVVLFVQLMPKFMKADMNYERSLLKVDVIASTEKKEQKLFKCDDFGLTALALAIFAGLLLGSIKIPLTDKGYNGACFSLGTTGGVLIMCLVFGHFGRIGKLSLEVPAHSAKVLRELGLMLFLIGAGVEGGVSLVSQIKENPSGPMIVVWGFIGGAVMTIVPMIVGFILGGKILKLPLLNSLGSITGGMTSTPALGTLINSAETEDVAGAYASTYPIALVLIVLACNLMIGLIG